MALTKKQEMFCQEVLKQDTYSDAYRIAYNASGMSAETINSKASILMADGKIRARVDELKSKLESKALYTIEQSMKRDLSLIERYEAALDVLENDKAEKNQVEAAERTIRHIGASAYNSAQERLSKQSGWFKKDNSQRKSVINLSELSTEEILRRSKVIKDLES